MERPGWLVLAGVFSFRRAVLTYRARSPCRPGDCMAERQGAAAAFPTFQGLFGLFALYSREGYAKLSENS